MKSDPQLWKQIPKISRAIGALLWVILAATLLVGGVLVRHEYLIRSQTSSLLIQQRVDGAERQLTDFFRPLVSSLLVLRDWGIAGQIDLDRTDELTAKLSPLCLRITHISSLEIAGADGRSFRLVKTGGGCRQQEIPEGGVAGEADWFQGAQERPPDDPFYWTAASQQSPESVPGPSLSVSWKSGWPPSDYVAALHLSRDVLVELVTSLPVGERGEVFWVNEKGESTLPREQIDGQTTDSGKVAEAVRALQQHGEISEPLKFLLDGETWWFAQVTTLLDSKTIRVGLALPQRELVEDLRDQEFALLYVLGGLVLMGLGLVVCLIWLRRLDVNVSIRPSQYQSASPDELRALIQGGETVGVEFKSTMRWNLNKDQPGKEVEFSWLRTVVAFLNSNGGTLLIGVGDTGGVVGIEADRFPNEDKFLLHFNNLLNEHVGLEFSSRISFGLRDVEGKKILVVDCRPADQAVFLKKGNVEEFLIRVGPGNRQLPPSKVLEYMASRKS